MDQASVTARPGLTLIITPAAAERYLTVVDGGLVWTGQRGLQMRLSRKP